MAYFINMYYNKLVCLNVLILKGNTMKPIIECKNLTLGYDNIPVVSNINIAINNGDYICVVGENGSGKSTFIKTLLGLIKPISGMITIDHSVIGKNIGYLPQQSAALKDFPATVSEVVISGCLNRTGLRPFYTRSEKSYSLECMKKLDILSLKNTSFRNLSGGQQQRVLIARALCATDRVLILDEPVTGLDPAASKEMYDIINKLNKVDGVTIIMISHDINRAIDNSDMVLHLSDSVLFYGTSSDYIKSKQSNIFLGGDTNAGN